MHLTKQRELLWLRPMKFSTCSLHANTGEQPGIRYETHTQADILNVTAQPLTPRIADRIMQTPYSASFNQHLEKIFQSNFPLKLQFGINSVRNGFYSSNQTNINGSVNSGRAGSYESVGERVKYTRKQAAAKYWSTNHSKPAQTFFLSKSWTEY